MEHNTNFFESAKAIIKCLNKDFTYIDVGCSGGIDDIWRLLGKKLQAYCFDPNINEINRLTNTETNKNISYIDAFVDGIDESLQGAPNNNPFERFSCTSTVNNLKEKQNMSNDKKTNLNLWNETKLTVNHIAIPDFLDKKNVSNVDFIKIDIDGNDFCVLHSISKMLNAKKVLGVGIEVNFFGTGDEKENSFHNIDRFMKQHDYTLFALSTRKYSLSALPGKYAITMPAQTEYGRAYQGDAVYFKDTNNKFTSDNDKILKLALLFSMFDLPDCAADLLIKHREKLEKTSDINKLLDVLTRHSIYLSKFDDRLSHSSYKEYLKRFKNNEKMFYPNLTIANSVSKWTKKRQFMHTQLSKVYHWLKHV